VTLIFSTVTVIFARTGLIAPIRLMAMDVNVNLVGLGHTARQTLMIALKATNVNTPVPVLTF